MAENDHQANAKLVLGHLRKANRIMTRTELYRRVDAKMNKRDLDNVVDYLVTSGQVEALEEKTGDRGRPRKSYRLLTDDDAPS